MWERNRERNINTRAGAYTPSQGQAGLTSCALMCYKGDLQYAYAIAWLCLNFPLNSHTESAGSLLLISGEKEDSILNVTGRECG